MAGVAAKPLSTWARGFGVTLRPAAPADFEATGVQRALRDGIERGYEGELPAAPDGCEAFAIVAPRDVAGGPSARHTLPDPPPSRRRGSGVVGVLAFVRGTPREGSATIWCVAIVPEQRGHAYGARALLAAERRLHRDGVRELYMRVPRGNGRGLYFALRCGYAPIVAPVEDGATWFRRNVIPVGRSAVVAPRSARPRQQRAARGSSDGS